MTKFFVASLVLLALVIGFVIYQAGRFPGKAESNQQALLSNALLPIDVATPAAQNTNTPSTTATIETSKGVMVFELFAAEAPLTVSNFVTLSQKNFYNGTIFHRIIKDFMIQGGDPKGDGTGGPGYSFADEPVTRDYTRGTLAMANSGPNTNGSQFFIMTKDTALPKNYTIFGKLTSGDDVLQKIAETPVTTNEVGEASKPTEKVSIISINIKD